MNEIALKLCDIQGRLFELSADHNYGSMEFIKLFMNSETAKALDSEYNRMQWAGEEYLLDEVIGNAKTERLIGGEVFSKVSCIGSVIFIVIGIITAVRTAKRYINKQQSKL